MSETYVYRTTEGCFSYSLQIVRIIHFQSFWSLICLSLLQILQECNFKKNSDDTSLRVFYNGVLSIFNCNDCCKRWYFTFNGAECSAPLPIDGVVYMRTGAEPNALKELLRVRHIEGVCENIPKGEVKVGFWVGNCRGWGDADARTAWNSVARIYVEEMPPPQHH